MDETLLRLRRWVAWALLCAPILPAGGFAAEPAASGLQAFRNEAEMLGFFQRLLDEERQRREAEKAARLAEFKRTHPNADPADYGRTIGSIAGTTASNGLVVIENAATGFRRELTADANGHYRVGSLPTGSYTVTAHDTTRTVHVTVGATASGMDLDTVTVAGAALSDGPSYDAITNVQTAGVDEGGIVKKAGDFLVILRRGRLFSIRADGDALEPIASINAFGPDIDGSNAWYDEMLISGSTIIVIGYSYERAGTEVGLFDLQSDGRMRYRATYHLISNDYYSSSNYASRLIGDELVFYSPIYLFPDAAKEPTLPGLRLWRGNKDGAFRPIAAASRVYRSRLAEESLEQTLHTVTRCRIGDGEMDCSSTAVIGPWGSAFYVSREAVYVWIVRYHDDAGGIARDMSVASVVRMPLDGSTPTALRVQGSPIDQMSFLDQDGYLNVLVGAESRGLRMWDAKGKTGALALLRVPIHGFGDARTWSRPEHYRALPSGPGSDGYFDLHNRYVGSWLLYGGEDAEAGAFAVRFDRNGPPVRLALGHSVDRIEAMGNDAVIAGSARDNLLLSSVALGDGARIAFRFTLPGASQEDERSHGFFYKSLGTRRGIFGLPVVDGKPGDQRASVQFLRNKSLELTAAGALFAHGGGSSHASTDGCVASCFDWYGDARPIFVGDRVYGLLGYELVEGVLLGDRVRERRRVNFMPTAGQP
jgi:hypothetical protein